MKCLLDHLFEQNLCRQQSRGNGQAGFEGGLAGSGETALQKATPGNRTNAGRRSAR